MLWCRGIHSSRYRSQVERAPSYIRRIVVACDLPYVRGAAATLIPIGPSVEWCASYFASYVLEAGKSACSYSHLLV